MALRRILLAFASFLHTWTSAAALFTARNEEKRGLEKQSEGKLGQEASDSLIGSAFSEFVEELHGKLASISLPTSVEETANAPSPSAAQNRQEEQPLGSTQNVTQTISQQIEDKNLEVAQGKAEVTQGRQQLKAARQAQDTEAVSDVKKELKKDTKELKSDRATRDALTTQFKALADSLVGAPASTPASAPVAVQAAAPASAPDASSQTDKAELKDLSERLKDAVPAAAPVAVQAAAPASASDASSQTDKAELKDLSERLKDAVPVKDLSERLKDAAPAAAPVAVQAAAPASASHASSQTDKAELTDFSEQLKEAMNNYLNGQQDNTRAAQDASPRAAPAAVTPADPAAAPPAAAPWPAPETVTTTQEKLVSSVVDDPEPLFKDGWQNTFVDPLFSKTVSTWGDTDTKTCSAAVTHRSVKGNRQLAAAAAPKDRAALVNVVEKHVEVEVPKIIEERIPFIMNVTQDRMIYQPVKQKIPKYIAEEEIEWVRKEVEVPKIVEKVKTVEVAGPVETVVKKVDKSVTMDVVTVRMDEVAVPFWVSEETPVYKNISKKVQRKEVVPKFTKRKKEVEVIKIEEVLVNVPANATSVNLTGGTASQQNEKIEVEVAKVKVREVKKPVEIVQEKVVYKTVKQRVERRIEKPEVKIRQVIVEVPQYKEKLVEVPVIEVRNRTVEVEREELEVEVVEEEVELLQERLFEDLTNTPVDVSITTETPLFSYEEVKVPETQIQIDEATSNETVSAVEWTNVTQEVLDIEEDVEYVDKIVELLIEEEQIVEVPVYVEKVVMKEVLIETTREEIEEVVEEVIVNITREEPEVYFKDVEVVLKKDEIQTSQVLVTKELLQEELDVRKIWREVEVKDLVAVPYPVQEAREEVDFHNDSKEALSGEEEPVGNDTVTEEIIVQDLVNKNITKTILVPETVITVRDVHVPVFEIEEEIIKVPTKVTKDLIVEVEKVYEQEKIVEVPGPPTRKELETEVIVPVYNDVQVVAKIEVPQLKYNKTEVQIPIYSIEEELITEELEIFSDEIVEVEKVVKVQRLNVTNGTIIGDSSGGPVDSTDYGITYIEKEVEQTVEIPEPVYVEKEVEVPLYEIEEVIVEVPKVTVLEEIVEVPRIVEIEKVVEVPRIEYQDVIVEKVVKKKVKQVRQKPKIIHVDKVVKKNTDTLSVSEIVTEVPFKVQVPKYSNEVQKHAQTTTHRTMDLTAMRSEVNVSKKVTAKKKMERLIPKEVRKVVKKRVEVKRELIQEKVVPVYKETVVKKQVTVPSIAVKEWVVKKPIKQEVLKTSTSTVNKPVDLTFEQAVNRTNTTKVQVITDLKPLRKTKEVPIAVPCSSEEAFSPNAQIIPGHWTTASDIDMTVPTVDNGSFLLSLLRVV
eukprot:TRINITY_DN7442_c0_g1_i8.p1 TRINITY_DN7442_c0_g1~~TRINITY_DN7442_c0_g1_i8.p1  ORF type:complete len:1370 (-),score=378.51 TRINITY_DN7442_c0_g1_i8:81-4190(-)